AFTPRDDLADASSPPPTPAPPVQPNTPRSPYRFLRRASGSPELPKSPLPFLNASRRSSFAEPRFNTDSPPSASFTPLARVRSSFDGAGMVAHPSSPLPGAGGTGSASMPLVTSLARSRSLADKGRPAHNSPRNSLNGPGSTVDGWCLVNAVMGNAASDHHIVGAKFVDNDLILLKPRLLDYDPPLHHMHLPFLRFPASILQPSSNPSSFGAPPTPSVESSKLRRKSLGNERAKEGWTSRVVEIGVDDGMWAALSGEEGAAVRMVLRVYELFPLPGVSLKLDRPSPPTHHSSSSATATPGGSSSGRSREPTPTSAGGAVIKLAFEEGSRVKLSASASSPNVLRESPSSAPRRPPAFLHGNPPSSSSSSTSSPPSTSQSCTSRRPSRPRRRPTPSPLPLPAPSFSSTDRFPLDTASPVGAVEDSAFSDSGSAGKTLTPTTPGRRTSPPTPRGGASHAHRSPLSPVSGPTPAAVRRTKSRTAALTRARSSVELSRSSSVRPSQADEPLSWVEMLASSPPCAPPSSRRPRPSASASPSHPDERENDPSLSRAPRMSRSAGFLRGLDRQRFDARAASLPPSPAPRWAARGVVV
ncbi:hypothetical protein JCM10207_000122, partial [Rhodosporidiobolus poonsookiae]